MKLTAEERCELIDVINAHKTIIKFFLGLCDKNKFCHTCLINDGYCSVKNLEYNIKILNQMKETDK